MADPNHLKMFRNCATKKNGAQAWNSWRSTGHITQVDLTDADLSDLWPTIMCTDVVRGFNLQSVDFSRSNLNGARFWEVEDLTHSNFTDCDLRGANFAKNDLFVCMTNADVAGAIFQNLRLGGLCGEAKNLSEARFEKVAFSGKSWQSIVFKEVKFKQCKFINCFMNQVIFDSCQFMQCGYEDGGFIDCVFNGCSFTNEDMSRVTLCKCTFLGGTCLRHADLSGADLCDSNLLEAAFSSDTTLAGAKVMECRVSRQQLERLSNYGGLTNGDRMDMVIEDPVAQLRSSYSGFWQWFHIAALVVFLWPYLWFIVTQWSRAGFDHEGDANTLMLGAAIARFIFNGGENWQIGFNFHPSFILFIFLMVYNGLRLIFLWKTKQLELDEQASGVPAQFVFDRSRFGWGWWYRKNRQFGYVYFLLGVVNVLHFLRMDIVI